MIESKRGHAWIDISREFAAFALVTLADGTFTATANGEALELQNRGTAALTLDVTAVSGSSPTIDVTIQTSEDGVTGWTSVGAFAQASAVGSQRKVFTGLDAFVRAVVTLGGTTPSFTASVKGKAY